MVICGRCNENVSEAIECSACHKHFDFPCSGITEKGYRKLGDRQNTWRCAACKNIGLASTNLPQSSITSPTSPSAITLDSVMQELISIRHELAPLSSLSDEMKIIRKQLCELKDLPTKVELLDERLTAIESVREDVITNKLIVSELNNSHRDMDQWARSNNLEIKGVPAKNNENLFEILNKIGTVISYPISKNQINFLHRVQSNSNGIKNIVVSFLCRYVKEDFLAAARSRKQPLLPTDIGLSGSGRIYLNDHLTVKNKMLLTQAKSIAKKHNYQYVWVKHAKIFVRRDQTSKSFVITSEGDLQKIH